MSSVAAREEAQPAETPAAASSVHAAPRTSVPERAARYLLWAVAGLLVLACTYVIVLELCLEALTFWDFLRAAQLDKPADHGPAPLIAAAVLTALVLVGTARYVRGAGSTGRRFTLETIPRLLSQRTWYLGALAVGSLAFLAFARLVFVYYRIAGGVDEGIYLVTAREAMAGGITYRDFPFIQGPLHPYLIGIFLAPFGYTENAARLLAIVLTLASLLLTAVAATRLGGRLAGVLAFAFLVTNLDYISDLTSGVHPSGPTAGFLLAVALVLLAYERYLWALLPLAILTGTRVLFAPLAILGVLLAAVALRSALRPLLVGAVLAIAAFGPFLIASPASAWFGIIGYQLQRSSLVPRLGGGPADQALQNELNNIQDAALRQVAYFWPYLLLLLIAAAVLAWPASRRLLGRSRLLTLCFLLAGSVALFVADALPEPYTLRYPTPHVPLAAVAGAVALAFLMRQPAFSGGAARIALPLAAMLVLVAPFDATREAVGSTNFVGTYADHPPVAALDEVAAYVESVTPPDGVLITLETPVASEAHRRLLPGLEMTSWGLLTLPDAQAEAVHMSTPNLLAQAIEFRRGAAVVTSDRYTWDLPKLPNKDRIQAALKSEYKLGQEFKNVSDWGNVQVYVPLQ